jgi:hypothetical protein
MSALRHFRRRNGGPPAAPATPEAPPRPNLVERRDALARDFAEQQWDLGGLAYEMALRGEFNHEVLTDRATRLQEMDAALAEAERLVALDKGAAAGVCPNCEALHGRYAPFCWHCGTQLLAPVESRLDG